MDEDKIRAAFDAEAVEKEIYCAKAFEIADRYKVKKIEIAEYCNAHGIKIRGCQLGCFK